MKKLNSRLGLFIYVVLLTGLILVSPLIAGVLNTFNSGETISSSQMNENFALLDGKFSELDTRLEDLCFQPGQIRVSALVRGNDTLDTDTLFSCGGADVTVEMQSVGALILVEGITDMNTIHAQVTPQDDSSAVTCETVPSNANPEKLAVVCYNAIGTDIDSSFYLAIINTPVTQ